MQPYSHRWSLPPSLSRSGLKPSIWDRVRFILVGILFIFLLGNGVAAALTEGQMLPGVTVANKPIGWDTQAQARSKLSGTPQDYKLDVVVGKKHFTTTSHSIGVQYDIDKTVELAYSTGRGPLAIVDLVRGTQKRNSGYVYSMDSDKLASFTSKVARQVGTLPVNATIKVVDGQLQTVPEQSGQTIKPETLQRLITGSLTNSESQTIHISAEPVQPAIKTSQLGEARNQAKEQLSRKITLNYGGKAYTASPTNIGYWLSFKPIEHANGRSELSVEIDDTQVKGWVQSIANEINIQPKTKKIVVADGTTSVEQEGQDGLAVNQDKANVAVIEAMRTGRDLSFDLTAGPVAFKTATTYAGGLSDARYIEINLSSQRLWAYQDHKVIYSSPVTSGATGAGFPTVTGTFHIYYKTTNTYLNGRPYGYNYNVFVQYWMPFYLGYGMHDASWRNSFGGQDYYNGGSHGCVNMPLATAAFLYNWADVGTTVWVHK